MDNFKFDHNANGYSAFGITDERGSELKKFVKHLVSEGRKNQWCRSQIIEKTIEFTQNPVEVAIISGWFENRVLNENARLSILDVIVAGDEDRHSIEQLKKLLIGIAKKQEKKTKRSQEGDDILRSIGLN